jgi:serralysin
MTLAPWTDDQVFNQLNSGLRWSGSTISYAFATSAAGMYSGGGEGTGFSMLGAAAQSSAKLALGLWDDLIAPDMQQITNTTSYSSANIEFGMSSSVSYGYTYYPSVGSVWLSANYTSGTNNLASPAVGQHGFYTYIHELGHSLGLEHMSDYNGSTATPVSYQDSTLYSVMSHYGPNWNLGSGSVAWGDWVGSDGKLYAPQTPMLNDIAAVQRIYGIETTTRVGDTVYGFNSNITDATAAVFDFTKNAHPVLAIFDSAGNDTLDLSGWSTPSIINLAPGSFSSCNAMTNNIAIAYSCSIENAVGGGGADSISGNALNNNLAGGAGNDIIYGLSGNDILIGGPGNDSIDGGDGTDSVYLADSWSNLSWSIDQSSGYLILASSTFGTDSVKNVEFFYDSSNVAKSFTDLTGLPAPVSAYAATVSIAATSAGQAEGTGATTIYHFTVTLSQASSEVETVNWAASFGTGTGQADANDFSGVLSGTATFAAGQATASVDLTVLGDSTVESDEAFNILLSNPSSGVTLATASAGGLIVNDDPQSVSPPALTTPGGSLTLAGTAASETLSGGSGNDTLTGLAGNDTLNGGAGNDLLDGGTGSDQMIGGTGDDIYVVDHSRDKVTEIANDGFDTVRTSLSSYSLANNVERLEYSGTGGFAGTGNSLANSIVGGTGNDMIDGGGGSDLLWGGTGADRFVFDAAFGSGNIDAIKDFNPGEDRLLLENAIFRALKATGTLTTGAFNIGSAATQADDRIIYDNHTGAIYYDSDGTGASKAIQFATIDPNLTLTNLNFEVI